LQDKFETYKASLSFQGADELAEFLITEYNLKGLNETKFVSDINRINSKLVQLELPKDKAGSLNVKGLNAETSPNSR
jgi:hypothetical protein